MRYDDRNGWPLSADGSGDSIVLDAYAADPQQPDAWRASVDMYGSPAEPEDGR